LFSLKETAIYRDFESAFGKIDKVLGRTEMRELRNLQEEVHFTHFHGVLTGLDREVVDAVHAACAEGQVLEVAYFSPERQVVEMRKLGPHFITYAGGALYLFAEELATRRFKTFALARMRAATMQPEGYSASRWSYQDAFGQDLSIVRGLGEAVRVVLRFRPGGAATYVRERKWHATQKIQALGDGSVRLEMTVALSSWLVKWLLGFEDAVQIMEPQSLRDQVLAAAEAIVRVYRDEKAA
jgi:predicted DNA-binding transcriptional regulator YafY